MLKRRRYVRSQVDHQAWLKLEQAEEEVCCQVKDISYKGAEITLKEKLPEDTAFRMRLRLAETCVINVEAWVAWCKAFSGVNHYGVYFDKIRDSDKNEIYGFLCKYCYNELKEKWWPDKIKREEADVNMEDRRTFQRFNVSFPAKLLDLTNGNEFLAETNNISAKGIGLTVKEPLPVNTPLEAWLDVPDKGGPLYARGLTVWSRQEGESGYRMGMDLERADLMGLSRILRV